LESPCKQWEKGVQKKPEQKKEIAGPLLKKAVGAAGRSTDGKKSPRVPRRGKSPSGRRKFRKGKEREPNPTEWNTIGAEGWLECKVGEEEGGKRLRHLKKEQCQGRSEETASERVWESTTGVGKRTGEPWEKKRSLERKKHKTVSINPK